VSEPVEGIKWTLLTVIPVFVFPFIYAKIRATVLSQGESPQKISRSLVRNDPEQLIIMAALFGIPSALILHCLNGPRNLLIIILGVTAVMLIISLVNIKYRASFHMSMVTSMLTALWFLFGPVSLITFLLIPVLGFSRYQMGEHTPKQIISGFLNGLVVGGVVFSCLRLTT
jgi:asparagine N-glycosylation enzyme membrane subunit Stt3